MKKRTKTIILIALALVIAIIGFFSGRATSEIKTVYVKGNTVTDTFYKEQLVPYEVEVPDKPNLPLKPDTEYVDTGKTIIKEIVMKVDTAKIISNYIKLNKYKRLMFDNNDGKLVVDAEVQYNELSKLVYTFDPIKQKVVVKRIISPFISASYNSFGYIEAGAGIFINNFGVEGKYVTNLQTKGFEVGLKYKF